MLIDARLSRGHVRNIPELCRTFGLTAPANERDLDRFVYQGFRAAGVRFLDSVSGRFGVSHYDASRSRLFVARDWIGETPLHLLATSHGMIVSNSLGPLRGAAGDEYDYRYVRAFPQSQFLELDLSAASTECFAETMRVSGDALFYDFAADCLQRDPFNLDSADGVARVRSALLASVRARAEDAPEGSVALLLSGGLDSLSVGLALKRCQIPFSAYTLSVGDGGDDPHMAQQFAKYLGVEVELVRVDDSEIVKSARQMVSVCDTYHLFNYYCCVGMDLLGRRLALDGMTTVFCGEGVNEALGDYHDWVVTSPTDGQQVTLQSVNVDRMSQVRERILYVWGHARDRGRYNRQLGTGLAKHASSRMYKPMSHHGLRLESPYLERSVMAPLVSIPPEELHRIGGKPGVFQALFGEDARKSGIPEDLIANSKKVRLQDASEGGRGGLSGVLLKAGLDQKWLIGEFNRAFGAGLDPDREARRLQRITA